MKATIHAEVDGMEGVQAYEGEDALAAFEFVTGLGDGVRDIQCVLTHEVNGEGRALSRRAKGADAGSLVDDIKAWLVEHAPAVSDDSGEASRETMTIEAGDVANMAEVLPDAAE